MSSTCTATDGRTTLGRGGSIVKQLMKCCVEEITPDARMIPFCAYNSVGYREQVRAEQSVS